MVDKDIISFIQTKFVRWSNLQPQFSIPPNATVTFHPQY